MNELSREYQLISKTKTGEILIAGLGFRGTPVVWELTEENTKKNASTLRKFETLKDIEAKYELSFEWFKNSEILDGYEFLNTCYFTENSKYGNGKKNRKTSI